MIEGYEDVVKEWTSPKLRHGCCNTVTIHPSEELDRWAIQQTITILANADYYYTKAEVDNLLEQISASGVTKEQVEEMIAAAIQDKADKADVEALSAQVASNTERILNTYTKPEVNNLLASYYTKLQTNSMFGNYSKVEDTTLILNSENITI
jgi:uncharacterized membrane protein YheB (UPF0754 family)